MEYATDETKSLSFIVSKEAETPFQRELLDNLCSDPILSSYPYSTLFELNDGTRHRQKSFNVIFVKDSETLQYVLFTPLVIHIFVQHF